ncbi:hypothetical protein ENSA5_21890 [Enhygromyxa salina]|uniref:Uncharacterized protein n=1 Tax=Enhygromyxa salina TaxID=215803 RepID=A0A2S9YBQ2_9BACT|nr:hypothetical protein [Enhygromyxa salina]PRQ02544.1 hypothetical protein ENSA5_21890 [Enhygromyxa salina]
MSKALIAYQDRLAGARQRLKERAQLRVLMGPEADPELLHAFLIQWAALSVQLQEPAEHFLVEASRRCAGLGEHGLSLRLLQIASEAIERYRLLADDTRTLAQLWNGRRLPPLDLTYLLTQPQTPSMKRLHAGYEALVNGPEPWALLAARYEAEAMLGSIAAQVTAQAERLLGADVRPCLRSVEALANFTERGSLDKTMVAFLEASPARVERMSEVGERTLQIYADFLVECCVAATNLSTWRDREHG